MKRKRPTLPPKRPTDSAAQAGFPRQSAIPCRLREKGECDCAEDRCLLLDARGRQLLYYPD